MLMMLSPFGMKWTIKKRIVDGRWDLFTKPRTSMWWWIRLTSPFNQAGMLTHLLAVGGWK